MFDERVRDRMQRAVITALAEVCRTEGAIIIPAAEATDALQGIIASLKATSIETRTRRDRREFGEKFGRDLARRIEAAQRVYAADGAPFRTVWDHDGGLPC